MRVPFFTRSRGKDKGSAEQAQAARLQELEAEVAAIGRSQAVIEFAADGNITTAGALKEMVKPGLLAVLIPLAVGCFLGPNALGGLLAGSLIAGVPLAIMLANAGGAWSPIGDVTTIMLWIGGQVTALNIVLKVFLPSVICLLIPLLIVSFTQKGEVKKPNAPPPGHHFHHEVSGF